VSKVGLGLYRSLTVSRLNTTTAGALAVTLVFNNTNVGLNGAAVTNATVTIPNGASSVSVNIDGLSYAGNPTATTITATANDPNWATAQQTIYVEPPLLALFNGTSSAHVNTTLTNQFNFTLVLANGQSAGTARAALSVTFVGSGTPALVALTPVTIAADSTVTSFTTLTTGSVTGTATISATITGLPGTTSATGNVLPAGSASPYSFQMTITP
jgi:hypothetical protein